MYKYEIVDGQVCGTCVHYRQHYIYRDGSYFPLWYGTVIVHGARSEPRTRYARIGSQFRTPVGAMPSSAHKTETPDRRLPFVFIPLFPRTVGLVYRPLHGVRMF